MAQLFRFLISGLFFSQETRVNAERLIATAVKSSSSVTWRGGPETLAFSFTGMVFKTEKGRGNGQSSRPEKNLFLLPNEVIFCLVAPPLGWLPYGGGGGC